MGSIDEAGKRHGVLKIFQEGGNSYMENLQEAHDGTNTPEAGLGAQFKSLLSGAIREIDLAKELERSRRCLWNWRRSGYGPPYYKIGKDVYYSRRAVQEWLEALSAPKTRMRSRQK
jgi:hypothetical protein